MSPERMTPAQKVQAIIGEFTEEYLIIIQIEGETAVSVSTPSWARALLASGQVDTAIDEHDAYLKAHSRPAKRKHHGPGEDGPPEPKQDDEKEA